MTYGAEGFLLRSLDGYGTVGTGLGAGTVQVRYGYGTGTIHGYGRYGTWVRFSSPCTVPTVPVPCTQIAAEIRTRYPNSGRNRSRSATISAAIWVHVVHGTVGTVHGYGTWVRKPYPCTVPTVPISCPYSTRTVPVPYPHPYPHPNPYQPSRTYHLAYRPASKMANRALLSKLAKVGPEEWEQAIWPWSTCRA